MTDAETEQNKDPKTPLLRTYVPNKGAFQPDTEKITALL